MTTDEPDFYSDPAIVKDPRSYFDRLRARCPVMTEPYHGSVMVTGYKEVMEVLTQRDDTYSSVVSSIGPIPPLPFKAESDDIRDQLDRHRAQLPWSAHLVSFDGEQHRAHRALLTNLLTHRRLKQNEEYLGDLVNRIIDRFISDRQCDVVSDFAHAVSTYSICDLMGIPEKDRAELLELIGAPPSQLDGDAEHKVGADPLIFLKERFDGYIRERLAAPRDDLMSELAHASYTDGSAPDPEMLSMLARFLYAAGQDTTSRLIAMAVLVLAENPALQSRLRADPKSIPNFLEEVLRYDPPVKVIYRLAQKATTIGEMQIPAGTVVTVGLSAAGNDPAHFEKPDQFDIDRPRVRDHLAFSRGAHGCPGAPLARLEARIAIERLLVRTSEIRISDAKHGQPGDRTFRFEPTYSFRSLSDLHIECVPA